MIVILLNCYIVCAMDFFAISYINLFFWMVFAAAAGYFVHLYDRRKVSGGIVLTSFFAIIGALVTGYLMSFISGKGMLAFDIDALLVTIVGASVFAFFYRFSFAKR